MYIYIYVYEFVKIKHHKYKVGCYTRDWKPYSHASILKSGPWISDLNSTLRHHSTQPWPWTIYPRPWNPVTIGKSEHQHSFFWDEHSKLTQIVSPYELGTRSCLGQIWTLKMRKITKNPFLIILLWNFICLYSLKPFFKQTKSHSIELSRA